MEILSEDIMARECYTTSLNIAKGKKVIEPKE